MLRPLSSSYLLYYTKHKTSILYCALIKTMIAVVRFRIIGQSLYGLIMNPPRVSCVFDCEEWHGKWEGGNLSGRYTFAVLYGTSHFLDSLTYTPWPQRESHLRNVLQSRAKVMCDNPQFFSIKWRPCAVACIEPIKHLKNFSASTATGMKWIPHHQIHNMACITCFVNVKFWMSSFDQRSLLLWLVYKKLQYIPYYVSLEESVWGKTPKVPVWNVKQLGGIWVQSYTWIHCFLSYHQYWMNF